MIRVRFNINHYLCQQYMILQLMDDELFQVNAQELDGRKFKLKNNKVISINEVFLQCF